MTAAPPVQLSPLDEYRFGIRTAKARLITPEDVRAALEFCRAEGVQLLIARCPSSALTTAHALEAAGGRLMDVLIYHVFDVEKISMPRDDNPIKSRFAGPEDASAVAELARAVFRGYQGHYHADPRLDPVKCDEVYVSWAERSCQSREVADAVLLLVEGDAILAFVTMRLVSPEEAEIAVGGVSPAAQGRGLYRTFIVRSMQWCTARRARRVVVSTQITNVAVQKVWSRLGFEPSHSDLTFHAWFDE
jgi:GNAT superfamily N-acetyltransferase